MEVTKMKCPICGKEEFIKTDLPFDVYGDAKLRRFNSVECHTCINCGYIVWFNKSTPKFFLEQKQRISEVDSKIEAVKDTIKQIQNVDYMSRYKKDLAKYKKELKFLTEMGEDNKTTRSLKECVDETQRIIDSGVVPGLAQQIRNLEWQIEQLNIEKSEYEKRIKTT